MVSFKLRTEHKTKLYYCKFQYKAALTIKNIGRIRDCKNLEQFIKKIEWLISRRYVDTSYLKSIDLDLFEKLINFRVSVRGKIFVRLDFNKISFYSNDLNVLRNLEKQFPNIEMKFSQVIPSSDDKIMHFRKEPPTKYRLYLKSGKISMEDKSNLKDLIERYSTTENKILPSKKIKKWLENSSQWIWNSSHIGYNDEKTLTVLALTVPDLIGKAYKLEKLKK